MLLKNIKLSSWFAVCMVWLVSVPSSLAADLKVSVTDTGGQYADSAVVTLLPLFETDTPAIGDEKPIMKQQGAKFWPFVLPVRTGTGVSFPNFDEFRHHVYSFSKAKRLEIRLYGKDESNEILFDQAGAVALGCNIHDNMLAYVYVTDDPYYRVTNENGVVQFSGLVAGSYKLTVWHPDQKSKKKTYSQNLEIPEATTATDVTLKLRSVRRRQKEADGREYN